MNNKRMETFGERLKRLRLAAGLTQERLGLRAGLGGQSAIGNYEKNKRMPSTRELPKLAQALGVSEAALVDKDASMNPLVDPAAVRELRMLLALTARSLAVTIPAAGRELLAAIEGLSQAEGQGTFAEDLAEVLRATLAGQLAPKKPQDNPASRRAPKPRKRR